MPVYQPQPNPLLARVGIEPSADVTSMASPMGMAAREPARFLARKLAGLLSKQDRYIADSATLQRQLLSLVEKVEREGLPPELLQGMPEEQLSPTATQAFEDLATTEAARLERIMRRAKDAMDVWRTRNLPIGEAVRRSTHAPSLYDWYQQALRYGPRE